MKNILSFSLIGLVIYLIIHYFTYKKEVDNSLADKYSFEAIHDSIPVLDSLDKAYKKYGFDSFVDAAFYDEYLYLEAALKADKIFPNSKDYLRRTDLELALYKKKSGKWFKEHNLDKTDFYNDKLKTIINGKDFIGLSTKTKYSIARESIIKELNQKSNY